MQTFDVGGKARGITNVQNRLLKDSGNLVRQKKKKNSLELSRRRHQRQRPYPVIVKLPHDKPVIHPDMSLTDPTTTEPHQ
jgi:hypothetical protein